MLLEPLIDSGISSPVQRAEVEEHVHRDRLKKGKNVRTKTVYTLANPPPPLSPVTTLR